MDKNYSPETIEEQMYPGETGVLDFSTEQSSGGGVHKPPTIIDQKFPHRTVANEIVGGSINTISGQVFDVFNFTEEVTWE